ncbi:DUF2142 domain-containing protein [Lichenicoccus sp.]|uniref:DUF2142 domain-containing protein n=1 Tax=Lichenicoccus sp. TaxID=2781899 RepID=UPI003D0AB02C
MQVDGYRMNTRLRDQSTRPDVLAALFCVYGGVAVLAITLLMPPFQAADELAHFERADQVSLGTMVATRTPDGSTGGRINRAIPAAGAAFGGLKFHTERKVTRPKLAAADAIGWTQAGRGDEPFPNTAIYPPFLYIPAAIGIDLGRLTRLSVLHTLELSRLLTGLASIGIAALAIARAGGAATFLFTVLCLPMSLALFASVSQDGPMIALAALACSSLQSVIREAGRGLVAACLSLALVLMARPPYLPLAFILLMPRGLSPRRRVTACAAVILSVLCWSAVASHWSELPASAAAISRQLHVLGRNPMLFADAVAGACAADFHEGLPWGRQFIGVLGWLDTSLPVAYYRLASVVLLGALASCCPQELLAIPRRVRLFAACCVGAAVVATLFFQYLSWTPTGAGFIDGVQGRYFLPIALMLPLLLPGLRIRAETTRAIVRVVLCAFPALSIALALHAIVWRYYL